MARTREKLSGFGLLPRMEARVHKDGKTVTYRYHPVGGKPINLGKDRHGAIQKVLDLTAAGSDHGTVNELWRAYQQMPQWNKLGGRTKQDYAKYSVHLLRVMGSVPARFIRPADISRYLRVERAEAPVRANREIALLSNLMNVAIERGEIDANPCKQVKRNSEASRTESPEPEDFQQFTAWIEAQGGQRAVIGMMAEFAALSGSRRAEFLGLTLPQIDDHVIRLMRAKQHGGKRRVENVIISESMQALVSRLKQIQRPHGCLYVFTTKHGQAYSESAFMATWQRLMRQALADKIIQGRFTFHDLRAFYTTQHKAQYGALPELHANTNTTAKVYDRSRISVRKGL